MRNYFVYIDFTEIPSWRTPIRHLILSGRLRVKPAMTFRAKAHSNDTLTCIKSTYSPARDDANEKGLLLRTT